MQVQGFINKVKKLPILIFIIAAGCGGKDIRIEDFDQQKWKEDQFGCKSDRIDLSKTLLDKKEELLGRSNGEIIEFLGKPDKTELYRRNQKFFHYYLTPGAECSATIQSGGPAIISLRFNATGLVNEITLFN